MAVQVKLEGQEVKLLLTREEVGNRIPGINGIGYYPKGVPVRLQRCYSCGRPTRSWFGFRGPISPGQPSEIYFLCRACEGPVDSEGEDDKDEEEAQGR